ncbi:MAG: flagellar motor switch protein FliN [Acidobacteria bacterium]|nr:flagellar motor switch protein FliN [Acidobacteriota bacterium]
MAESDSNDLDALEDIDNLEQIDPKAGERESSKGTASGMTSGTQESVNLDLILDIPLNVTVELGRNKMLINELLQLGQGSVIELTKMVGEPLEVMVNNKLVARGEVVVINEKFGVRLTDIVSPLERVQSLS